MSERFDFGHWQNSPEHAQLLAGLEHDYEEARERAKIQAKKDIDAMLEQRRALRDSSADSSPQPESRIDFREISDDLLDGFSVRAVDNTLFKK